jgi:hypothetical protein
MADVNGTPGNDDLTGTDGADVIRGFEGNDTIRGGGNQFAVDVIYGNQGDDLIYGNQDTDVLFGGQGNDTAFGGQGADVVYGNLGNDVIYGNLGNDRLYGGQGDDILYGGQGDDTLIGGLGNDILYGGVGRDLAVLAGSAGGYEFSTGEDGTVSARNLSTGAVTLLLGIEDVQIGSAPGETQIIEVPGPTQIITVPGPTVTKTETISRNPDGFVHPTAVDGQGNQLFGAGNSGEHSSTVDITPDSVQLYLRPHERGQNGDSPIRIDSDGVAVYQLPAGMQTPTRTSASFDFGIATYGSSTVDDERVQILIDGDRTSGTNYTTYKKQTRVGGRDAVFATTGLDGNPTGFGGDVAGQGPDVSANSANFGFQSIRQFIDGDPNTADIQAYNGESGLFDVIMRTTSDLGTTVDNHIRLQIGDGSVPAPVAA